MGVGQLGLDLVLAKTLVLGPLWKMCRIVLMADNMADNDVCGEREDGAGETNAASSEIEHKIFLIKNYFFPSACHFLFPYA